MNAPSFSDFESASRAVLEFLHARLGFGLWMVTRTEGEDWIVLQTKDRSYGVDPGAVFRWADSFCSQMVRGNGPRIAPNSESIPAYASAPIATQVPIKSYVGQPIVREDGSLFGTLCAIDPASQPESIVADQPLVELLGAMLSTVLQCELKAVEEARRAERLEAEALSDGLTHVYNRMGWNLLVGAEESRCRRFGHPAAVLVIDLDGLKAVNDTHGHAAGDALIQRAAASLRHAARAHDAVARLGGDEFGILSAECDRAGADALLARVRQALSEADVEASVGLAMRQPSTGLMGAWEEADHRMYADKRARGGRGR